jgi:hypothetical protein
MEPLKSDLSLRSLDVRGRPPGAGRSSADQSGAAPFAELLAEGREPARFQRGTLALRERAGVERDPGAVHARPDAEGAEGEQALEPGEEVRPAAESVPRPPEAAPGADAVEGAEGAHATPEGEALPEEPDRPAQGAGAAVAPNAAPREPGSDVPLEPAAAGSAEPPLPAPPAGQAPALDPTGAAAASIVAHARPTEHEPAVDSTDALAAEGVGETLQDAAVLPVAAAPPSTAPGRAQRGADAPAPGPGPGPGPYGPSPPPVQPYAQPYAQPGAAPVAPEPAAAAPPGAALEPLPIPEPVPGASVQPAAATERGAPDSGAAAAPAGDAPPVQRSAAAQAVAGQRSAPADAADLARADTILSQVRMHLRPGMKRATLSLRPESLGRISIELSVDGGRLNAIVRAESPETLAALERHVPELRALMAQAQLEVQSFELSLTPDGSAFDSSDGRGSAGGDGDPTAHTDDPEASPSGALRHLLASDASLDLYA